MKYPGKPLLLLTAILAAILLQPSCKKDDGQGEIPTVLVNFVMYPNTLDYVEIGGWIYKNEYGYRGIIIYRMSPDDFMAYERTCPHDPEKSTAIVEVESSGVTAVDSTCMSRFLLTDGSAFSGPSTRPLKQYRTEYDGNKLYVTN